MGFRGEALAAIASVAELSHRQPHRPTRAHAMRLDARSGELAPAARGVGTSVEVRELFFSTPARRKFLKTDATELAHCVEAVRRHALRGPTSASRSGTTASWSQQWRARGGRTSALRDVLGEDFVAQQPRRRRRRWAAARSPAAPARRRRRARAPTSSTSTSTAATCATS